ncbi:hypothetical protein Z968_04190 [Clostridium novyi A str. 4552]|uniref:Uncharacterized protein n=1 Tax=Clostridium novyi A str. 4552 TaxID=1444289 RepID=A0A0A0I730_CLONO|nr:hypothetical protein [Clostridium novyi]KGM97209.1 hypothetical protein Z968_04190 [Clostridium novyi A str. 4552]
MERILTIFKWQNDSEPSDVKNLIKELTESNIVKVKEEHIAAFAGDLAGMAIDFFTSAPVQAIATAYTLKEPVYKVFSKLMKVLKSNKKQFKVGKKLAETIVLFEYRDLYQKCRIEDIKILESDLIENFGGCLTEKIMNNVPDATIDNGYLVSIGIPTKNKEFKVIWNIINTRGEIKVTWETKKYI